MREVRAKATFGDLSDGEIAARVAAGDKEVLVGLMRRYNQKLYRTARSILRDDAEAEDAVQESYLLAHAAIGGYRGEASLSTWLVRIVVNEALGRLRRRKRGAEIIQLSGDMDGGEAPEADIEDNPMQQPDALAMRAQSRRLIEAAIDTLPDTFRAVFMMRAVEEMSVEETSQALGVAEATVRSRYFRARGLLREALAREMDFALEGAFAFDGERCDRIIACVLNSLEKNNVIPDPR